MRLHASPYIDDPRSDVPTNRDAIRQVVDAVVRLGLELESDFVLGDVRDVLDTWDDPDTAQHSRDFARDIAARYMDRMVQAADDPDSSITVDDLPLWDVQPALF